MDTFSRIGRDIDAPTDADASIDQFLNTLGMTREDLERHSVQMRQFLTAENVNSFRAMAHDQIEGQPKVANPSLKPKPVSSVPSQRYPYVSSRADASASVRSQDSLSQSSMTVATKSRPTLQEAVRHSHSLTQKLATHKPSGNGLYRKRNEEYRQRGGSRFAEPSSSPTKAKPSLDAVMSMRSRVSRRPPPPDESDDSGTDEHLVSSPYASRSRPCLSLPHPGSVSSPFHSSKGIHPSLCAFKYVSGIRSPCTSAASTSAWMAEMSSGFNSDTNSAARAFSSTRSAERLPGIGMTRKSI